MFNFEIKVIGSAESIKLGTLF